MLTSNYTSRGFLFLDGGNKELNIAVCPSSDEVKKIHSYIEDAHLLTKPMWLSMKRELDSLEIQDASQNAQWSEEILDCLSPAYEKLWVAECLYLAPQQYFEADWKSVDYIHDLEIIGSKDPTIDDLKGCKVFKWLDNLLSNNKGSLRFGYITSALHDSFIDDPTPYRKDVKTYVEVIFMWCEWFEIYPVTSYKRTKALRGKNV
jgi:hypothetical protein